MRSITESEMNEVAGGVIVAAGLIAVLAFEWYEAGHIREFCDGLYDGLGQI